jgi:isopentenyl diphosphate isomerase/L-lactate dehydrogenase-like FMN-dependent dehydrogenase
VHNHADARLAAQAVLPPPLFDFVDGGSDDEVTLRRNEQAFQSLTFRPRMGVWCPAPEIATTVLGTPVSFPVLAAPCGGMRLVHPEGDLGVARAAAALGTIHVVPSGSGYTLEEVAAIPGAKWFQLYRMFARRRMEDLVERADRAGYLALVITIDTFVGGNRERDIRSGFDYNMRPSLRTAWRLGPQLVRRPRWLYSYYRDGMPFVLANTMATSDDGQPMSVARMAAPSDATETQSATWEDVRWVRNQWRRPILIKGVLTVDDALRAVDLGADGVIVSNHGGRQLDGAPATIDVMPQIASAVGDQATVLLDSGVRRGSDVVKAVALGAQAVLAGRVPTWGLAIAGSAGVAHTLAILRDEMIRTMQLAGCSSAQNLGPDLICR